MATESTRSVNRRGLDLIKSFEGLRLKAYRCPALVWTIGYGHTRTAARGQVITTQQAEQLLVEDLENFETGVTDLIGDSPTTDDQFSALVSFAFNCGLTNLGRSTLLKRHNAGLTAAAANQFLRWNRAAGRVLPGLTRRREAERRLYLSL